MLQRFTWDGTLAGERRARLLLGIALLAACSGCGWGLLSEASRVRRDIVFDSDRDGRTDIYVLQMGTRELQLTQAGDAEFNRVPDWSPDGTELVFQSKRRGGVALYIMRADGSRVRRLTHHKGEHGAPAWSPDGRWVAFTTTEDTLTSIDLVRVDGSDLRRLVAAPAFYPAWSPDSKQVAYVALAGGAWNIFVASLDGSVRQLTRFEKAGVGGPAWSPRGGAIAFDSDDQGSWDIYVIRSDGSQLRRLTTHAATDARPSWSCDGNWIAFHSDRSATTVAGKETRALFEIYVTRSDGTAVRRLTTNEFFDAHPDWC